eukprot:TRINITY_DN3185_c0_g1_i1.p1 TRINITY_DN3185_c0_g1~~TRINITY_DN3185_c0_g1_i1.p1  ORF type:complete len:303 (+),score=41.08 TRINITY_DN3185_c0_g1_i1:49-957(+)
MMLYALLLGIVAAALAVIAFTLHVLWKGPAARDTPPDSTSPSVAVVRTFNIEGPNGQQVVIDMESINALSTGLEYLLSSPRQCPVCLEFVHPSLFEGHTEVCRIHQQARQRTPSLSSGSDSTFEEGDECVICLTKQRSVAFVPCGHWSCCKKCASKITTCPMCREQVREHLYVSGKAVNKCPVCKIQIHPTFYTSHREVCRIQMAKREREAASGEEAKSPNAEMSTEEVVSPHKCESNVTSPKSDDTDTVRCKPKCAVCNEKPREVAFSPCGHWASCTPCSENLTECPICNVSVRSSIAIFS